MGILEQENNISIEIHQKIKYISFHENVLLFFVILSKLYVVWNFFDLLYCVQFLLVFPQNLWIKLYIAVMVVIARSYIAQSGFSSVQKGNRFLRWGWVG